MLGLLDVVTRQQSARRQRYGFDSSQSSVTHTRLRLLVHEVPRRTEDTRAALCAESLLVAGGALFAICTGRNMEAFFLLHVIYVALT